MNKYIKKIILDKKMNIVGTLDNTENHIQGLIEDWNTIQKNDLLNENVDRKVNDILEKLDGLLNDLFFLEQEVKRLEE